MKRYKKAKVLAKNRPTGSYAAGCPANEGKWAPERCRNCERTM